MKYAFLVALREYAENVKTKGFWVGLILFPIIIWASIRVPRLLEEKARPTRYFCLVDYGGSLSDSVDAYLEQRYQKRVTEAQLAWMEANKSKPEASRKPFEEPKARFVRVPLPAGASSDAPDALAESLRPYLRGDRKIEVDGKPADLFALVILPKDLAQKHKDAEFWCTNLADTDLKEDIEEGLKAELRKREYVGSGLTEADVKRIDGIEISFFSKDPKKEAGKEAVDRADKIRQWAPAGFVYLLFVALMTVSQMLLNNSIEEKSNRIVEVLLSSVTAGELMTGKLLGIAAVGFTMMSSWILSGVLVIKLSTSPEVSDFTNVILDVLLTPKLLIAFGGYFLLGYLLYASLFLAVGSLCNTLKEAQNFMGPIMTVMMVPIFLMAFIPKDPNGVVARVASWIPLYTPFVMLNRAAADPPLFDLIGTAILLILSAIGMLWAAGKIFRIGILRTGQPPKIAELVRWLRQPQI